jgi:hypothetical protein
MVKSELLIVTSMQIAGNCSMSYPSIENPICGFAPTIDLQNPYFVQKDYASLKQERRERT